MPCTSVITQQPNLYENCCRLAQTALLWWWMVHHQILALRHGQ